jgi:phosphatidylserine synthase
MLRPAKAEVEEAASAAVEDEAVDVAVAAVEDEVDGAVARRTFGFQLPSLVAS